MEQKLTHVNEKGEARIVDVHEKPETHRYAMARATLSMKPETLSMIVEGVAPKGDVLAVARVAGIMAAKRTSDIIPMCHPLPIDAVTVDIDIQEPDKVCIYTSVACMYRTGVEMEALTAAAVTALTIYDMCKAVDRGMVIQEVCLLEKHGGKSGVYMRE